MEPNNDQRTKIASLRADIQHAVAQADRGEVIRDFQMKALLQECHREHAMLATVKAAP
jgi:hypothetical protein